MTHRVLLGVPLLSTGITGSSPGGLKLIGPGHASFVTDAAGEHFAVFHASMGSQGGSCSRYAFVSPMSSPCFRP